MVAVATSGAITSQKQRHSVRAWIIYFSSQWRCTSLGCLVHNEMMDCHYDEAANHLLARLKAFNKPQLAFSNASDRAVAGYEDRTGGTGSDE